jgi:hypothetical protein
MAFVAADWTILRTNGANPNEIDYVGDAHAGTAPTYATGIELHRALQDFADDSADGTEEISIVDEVPSQRGGVDTNITLINGYHITPTAHEHLYDTSISQTHPVDGVQIYDGIQVFGNSTSIQVIQNGARLTNDFWNEAKMIAAVSDATSNTSHRFMVLVRDSGADIDGRRLIGTQRVYGTTYTEFAIGGGTNRGNNVLALTANSNLNNATAQGTIDALTFVIAEGYVPIDGDGNGTPENYYVEWDTNGNSKNEAYEYSQNMIREGVAVTPVNGTFGLDPNIFRGITHSVAVTDLTSGIWVEPEALSWGTGATAGTGQLLAIDNTASGSATILYMQLLTGVLPNANTITGATNGASGTAGTITGQVVSVPPIGASTGANIKGAYGVGIQEADLEAGDTLLDLTGAANNAPNNVTFSVIGLNITTTADYVLVGPDSAGSLQLDQLGQNAAVNTTVTSLVMDSAIPVDTPATGSIRCLNVSGEYVRHDYSAWTGSTFTITSYDFSPVGLDVALGANVFISYIDKVATATTETFNTVFNTTRALRVIVRNGATVGGIAPIVPIDVAGSLGSGGGAATLSRVLDT